MHALLGALAALRLCWLPAIVAAPTAAAARRRLRARRARRQRAAEDARVRYLYPHLHDGRDAHRYPPHRYSPPNSDEGRHTR